MDPKEVFSNNGGVKKTKVGTSITKCDSCGSTMVFDPSDGRLRCIHCSSRKPIAITRSFEIPYREDNVFDLSSADDRAMSFRCKSCGAVSMMNSFETTEKCPFCGVDNIVQLEDLPIIKPNAILPFSVTLDSATEAFKKWINKKLLSPKQFKRNFTVENVRGAYLPAWTFDAQTVCHYRGRLGKYETVVVGSGKNRRTERVLRWFHVSGSMNRNIDDFMIEASKSINQKDLSRVSPFDTHASVGFNQDFLAGFSAERYDKELDTACAEMKDVVKRQFHDAIMRKYNADRCDFLDLNVIYNNLTYRHILLPMWIDNYVYRNKSYRVLVNGRTAKVGGTAPKSVAKVSALVALGVAAVVVIALYFAGII